MKRSLFTIAKTYSGMTTLDGWKINYRGDSVAEFYGVPYEWVRKVCALWNKMGKPY